MKPKSIGIIAGGGGPFGATSILQEILSECQSAYGCMRSYEYPCINFYSYPFSDTMENQNEDIVVRELQHSIMQLKLLGMDMVVIPCFTMSSYLSRQNYEVEIIEMATIVQLFLQENDLSNPLVLCSSRTRRSGYCDNYFECRYPNALIQEEFNLLIEKALSGRQVDLGPILSKLPFVPILCATTVLCAQMKKTKDPRLINLNKLLAKYVVRKSFGRHYAIVGEEVSNDCMKER